MSKPWIINKSLIVQVGRSTPVLDSQVSEPPKLCPSSQSCISVVPGLTSSNIQTGPDSS